MYVSLLTPKLSSKEALARLASKPGVQATLVLSRKDGAVIQSSGFSSSGPMDQDEAALATTTSSNTGPAWQSNVKSADEAPNSNTGNARQLKTAEDTARAVFKYVSETGSFLESVHGADDVQLLRMRTKQHEIVIVPGKHVGWRHLNSMLTG